MFYILEVAIKPTHDITHDWLVKVSEGQMLEKIYLYSLGV